MAKRLGNERKFYLVSSSTSTTYTALVGEQTNSFNRSADALECSDKTSVWKQFLAGLRGAQGDVTVYADDNDAQQKSLIESFGEGETVNCFVGVLGSGSTPSEGDVFTAIITAINDTNDNGSISTRQISLTVTGAPTHYPTA